MNSLDRVKRLFWGILFALTISILVSWLFNSRITQVETLPGLLKVIIVFLGLSLFIALLPFGVSGIVRWLIKWFPSSPGYELTYTQTDLEDFQRHYWITAFIFLGFTLLISMIYFSVVVWAFNTNWQWMSSTYLLPTYPSYWVLPAFFAGLSLAGIPTWMVYRRLLRDRFPRFISFHNPRLGFDQRNAGMLLVFYSGLLTLALTIAGCNLSLRIDEHGMITRKASGLFGERYSFSEVTQIQENISVLADRPEQIVNHTFSIQFTDGYLWQSASMGNRPVPQVYFEGLQYAADQCNITIEKTIDQVEH